MDFNTIPGKLSRRIWIGLGLILLGGVAILDYVTGVELSFSLFYLIPISLLTWALGGRLGIVVACFSAGIWLSVDILSGAKYSSVFVYFWNTIIRLGFFLLPVFMIRLQKAMEHERQFARTDFLTGVFNARFFNELAQMELDRAGRYKHSFAIAFIDVDDFKTINDRYGHTTGDKVLRAIAANMKTHLRKTDIVARVGGDEFVILLPEAGVETASVVISNIQGHLLQEMQTNHWPVTFSIGVLALTDANLSVDEILGMADRMMYTVKNGGKNNIHYATYPSELASVGK